LSAMIDTKVFREDLFYRLSGMTLRLPALRERRDIDRLIDDVLADLAGGEACRIDAQARNLLRQFPWPGNIRQLINVLRYALALADDGYIDCACLPVEVLQPRSHETTARPALPLSQGLASQVAGDEGQRLMEAFKRHQWNITAVAEELAVARSTLYRKMKKHGIVQPNLVM